MRAQTLLLIVLTTTLAAGQAPNGLRPDAPIACAACDEWNAAREPFRVFGNTYYVGVGGLSSVLIASERGHMLLDGALPQSAAPIDASIRALGFRTEDVKLILNSHAHFDHAGGIAALQRLTGATVATGPRGAEALRRGEPTPDDPQYAFGRADTGFPPVAQVRAVEDGEVLRVGDLAVTAHLTPGHTPGGTSWSWRACEGPRCLSVVYADSLNAVSAPGFRFSGTGTRPGLVETFRRSIATVAALPCDIVIAVHPGFTDLDGKLAKRAQEAAAADPFIDANGCRAYAADAAKRLDARLAEEAQTSVRQ
jgi:metallo-beta-lactamase class B